MNHCGRIETQDDGAETGGCGYTQPPGRAYRCFFGDYYRDLWYKLVPLGVWP